MPGTALQHFHEDIFRARSILGHANSLPDKEASEALLRSDLLRSSWMFAVGALDAYFCDAYTDLVASTANSKSRQPTLILPEWFYDIKFPLRAVLEPYDNTNWRWRMAARKMMEKENVISLEHLKNLFNKFLPKGRKFFQEQLLDRWITHPDATVRMFGVTGNVYMSLSGKEKSDARMRASEQMSDRFQIIFQRRHDCIHNCDRPRMSPQPLQKSGIVLKVIQDVEFVVNRCDEHLNREYREFLRDSGASPATIAQAGY